MFAASLLGLFTSVTAQDLELQSGDVVFVSNTGSDLSKAIDEVTGGQSYTHMGVVEVVGSERWVIHSDFGTGVVRELLGGFQTTQGSVHAYRVSNLDISDVKVILEQAHALIGEPYNSTYIMEDTGYYCSEFVYDVFREADVFKLNPMTFVNPATGATDSTWISHYRDLGIPVPEGKPGCNPNGMATNARLKFMGVLEEREP